mmetsp:Transcript_9616/g.10594  ORF Transcript_9616/g.10594 Transcript_9616/m.10594 type:complete len:119 (+) Transcript_9616:90-446(+)
MGYSIKKLDATKTINANVGPDSTFGFDADFTVFRKTGSDKGISAAITLDLDTLAQSLLSWHLVGEFFMAMSMLKSTDFLESLVSNILSVASNFLPLIDVPDTQKPLPSTFLFGVHPLG